MSQELQIGKYEFHPNASKEVRNVGAEDIFDPVFLDESVIRLKSIGFKHVGSWKLIGENDLEFFLHGRDDNPRNVLYSFVANGRLKYIGKTVKTLAERMVGYRKYGPSQLTNKRNHEYICDCLRSGQAVDIYFLPDNALLNYGGFHINLAAGLEDDLIKKLNPPWNGGKKETESETLKPNLPTIGGGLE